jgi:hypothetical protein
MISLLAVVVAIGLETEGNGFYRAKLFNGDRLRELLN